MYSNRFAALSLFCATALLPAMWGAPTVTMNDVTLTLNGTGTQTATFVPNVSATSPTFAWQRNGYALPGQSSAALALTNVSLSDSDVYSVTVTDGTGSASASARLIVNPVAYLNGSLRIDPSLDLDVESDTAGQINATVPYTSTQFIVAGEFVRIAGNGGIRRIAVLNTADGALDPSFAVNANAAINSVIVLPLQTGETRPKVMIAGNFNVVNGLPRGFIARLNGADGSVDATFNLGTGPNNTINAMVRDATGKLIIGGTFTSYNGVTANRVCRLNADGSLDTTFATGSNAGFDSAVNSLAIDPTTGYILAGGAFTKINNGSTGVITRIARLKAGTSDGTDGQLDTTFASGAGFNSGNVNAIGFDALTSSPIVGGSFTNYQGAAVPGLVRLTPTGGLDTSFSTPGGGGYTTTPTVALSGPGSGANVTAIVTSGVVTGFTVTAGGTGYTSAPTVTISGGGGTGAVATATVSGGAVTAVAVVTSKGPAGTVNGLYFDGSRWLVGGSFTSYQGTTINRIARVSTTGGLDSTFNPNANGTVLAMFAQASDGKVVLGGSFGSIGSTGTTTARRIARVDGTTAARDTTIGVAFCGAGTVNKILPLPGGKFLIAGSFTHLGATPANNLVRLNNDLTVDKAFVAAGGSGYVTPPAVTVSGAGGTGSGAVVTAVLNSNGQVNNFNVTAAGTGYTAPVTVTVAAPTTPGGFAAVATATLSGTGISTVVPDQTNAGPNGTVFAAALQGDGKILLGGSFTSFNAIGNVNRVARLASDFTFDSAFSVALGTTSTSGATGTNAAVNAIALIPGGGCYIGGNFTNVNANSPARASIARIGATGAFDNTFDAGSNTFTVNALALQPDGKVIAGGSFTTVVVGTVGQTSTPSNIVRFTATGGVDPGFTTTANSQVRSLLLVPDAVQPNGKLIVTGDFGTVNGTNVTNITRLNTTDGSLDSTFANGTTLSSSVLATLPQTDGSGRILAYGSSSFTGADQLVRRVVQRFGSDGTEDAVFGVGSPGAVIPSPLPASFQVLDSGALLVGTTSIGTDNVERLGLARFVSATGLAPTIASTGLSVTSVRPGGPLTITGTNFTDPNNGNAVVVNTVRFGGPVGITAPFIVNSATQITIPSVPANAISGPVTVQTYYGSATSPQSLSVAPDFQTRNPQTVGGSFGAGAFANIAGVNIYVFASTGGSIVTSTNGGASWTVRFANSNGFNGLVYANGIFVAVGNSGTIVTSTDGLNWTQQPAPTTNSFTGVAFDSVHAKWLIVTNSTTSGGVTLISSNNAASWSLFTGSNGIAATAVAYGTAGAFTGFVEVGSSGAIRSSTDGITWTTQGSGVTTNNLQKVSAVNSQFLLGGSSGTLLTFDGTTVLARTANVGTSTVFNAAYGPVTVAGVTSNKYLVAGGTNLTTSSDLVTWTNTSLAQGSIQTILVGNNQYVIGGSQGSIQTTTNSTDITTLAPQQAVTLRSLHDVTYGNGRFVAVSTSQAGMATSTDGVTWSFATNAGGSTSSLNGVAYGSYFDASSNRSIGAFVAVGSNVILTSSDGLVWIPRTPSGGSTFNSVAFGGGAFVAVGNSGVIYRSVDGGVTWASVTSGTTQTLNYVARGASAFVAVGNSGTLLTSSDGSTWTSTVPTGISANLNGVRFGNGKFVVVGASSTVLTAPDTGANGGVTWTVATFPATGSSLLNVAYGDGEFVAVTGSFTNAIYTSPDAVTWTQVNLSLDNFNVNTTSAFGITYGNGRFVIVSTNGFITSTNPESDTFRLLTQPIGGAVNPASPPALSVSTPGAVTATYQWYQGVSGDTSSLISGQTGSTFTPPALTGPTNFWVRAIANGVPVDSASALLTSNAAAPTVTNPADRLVTTGNDATFGPVTASGTGTLTYQWRRAGIPLQGNTTANSATLVVKGATRTEADYYDVVVSDGFTSVASKPARLSVAPALSPQGPASYPQAQQLDPAFAPTFEANGSQAVINKLLLDGSQFYAVGEFRSVTNPGAGGLVTAVTSRIARFNLATGALDTSFVPRFSNGGLPVVGTAGLLAVGTQKQGANAGKVIIGGQISTIANGTDTRRLVRFNSDGTLDASFFAGDTTVSGFTVLNGGSGYTAPPIVTITGGGGSGAAGNAVIKNGVVTSITVTNPGSGYTSAPTVAIAAPASGTTATAAPNMGTGVGAGQVNVVIVQPDDKILVGGSFSFFNFPGRNCLLRLNPDGTLDTPFFVDISGPTRSVNALALSYNADGSINKIYVGGSFTTVNGQTRNRIAALNPDGSLDSTFNPVVGGVAPAGADNTVNSIVVVNDSTNPANTGKLVIGGSFLTYNGNAVQRMARITTIGAYDASLANFNGTVLDLACQSDGSIIAAGSFSTVNGVSTLGTSPVISVRDLVRLSSTTTATASVDLTFNVGSNTASSPSGLNSTVNTLALAADGSLLFGGSFSSINGNNHSSLARLTVPSGAQFSNGALDPTVNPSLAAYATPNAIVQSRNNQLLVAGNFVQVNGVQRFNLARINAADGSLDAGYNAGSGKVTSASVLVGGSGYTTVPNVTFNGGGGSGATATAAVTSGVVTGITIGNSGSGYTSAPAVIIDPPASGVAAVGVCGLDVTIGGGINGLVIRGDGEAVIVGQFQSVGGTPSSRIAWLKAADGSLDTSINVGSGFNNIPSFVVEQPDGKLLIGGGSSTFTYNSSGTRNGLVRLNVDGTLDTGFAPAINGTVNAAAVQPDGKIVVVGSFSTVGTTTVNDVARLNPVDGSLDSNFSVGTGPVSGTSLSAPSAVAIQADGRILIGGGFTTVNGTARTRIARLNNGVSGQTDGSVDTSFNPSDGGPNNTVTGFLLQEDGKIVVRGTFTSASLTGFSGTFTAIRYAADGTRDTSLIAEALGSGPNGIVMLDDGTLAVVGNSFPNFADIRRSVAHFVPGVAVGPVAIMTTPAGTLATDGSTTFDAGTNVTLAASYNVNATQPVTFQWWKEGVKIPGATNATLQLNNVQFADKGGYALDAANLFGTVSATPLLININTTPVINAQTPNQTVDPSGTLTLGADHDEYPGGATFQWLKDLVPIPGANSSTFTIVSAQPANAGSYREIITNSKGTTNVDYTVTLSAKPVIVTQPISANVSLGGSANLSVAATGSGTLSYQWLKNGGIITGAGGTSLALTNIAASDAAQYSVVVSNTTGSTTSASATVSIDSSFLDEGFAPPLLASVTDGSFLTVLTDGSMVIGSVGSTLVRTRTAAITKYLPNGARDLAFDGNFPVGAANIFCLAAASNGQFFASYGIATSVGAPPMARLAKFNADGTLDSTFAPYDYLLVNNGGQIRQLLPLSGGGVLAAGFFLNLNGTGRAGLAQFKSDGTLDPNFTVTTMTLNGSSSGIWSRPFIDSTTGKILIAGDFASFNGVSAPGIARLNSDGTTDLSFNAWGFTRNSAIRGMAVQSTGKIVLGGRFTVSSISSIPFVRLKPDGSLDQTFVMAPLTGPDGSAAIIRHVIPLPNDKFVGSDYSVYVCNPDGSFDSGFAQPRLDNLFSGNPPDQTPAEVFNLAVLPNGNLAFAGVFDLVGLQSRPTLAQVDLTGALQPFVAEQLGIQQTPASFARTASGHVLASVTSWLTPNGLADMMPDGSLATTPFSTALTSNTSAVSSVYPLPDGRVFAQVMNNATTPAPEFRRVLADGTADPALTSLSAPISPYAFDRAFVLGDGSAYLWAELVDPQAIINGTETLVHMLPSGAIDVGFAPALTGAAPTITRTNGTITAAESLGIEPLAVDSTGRIYVRYRVANNLVRLARLLANGSQDPAFATVTVPEVINGRGTFNASIIDPANPTAPAVSLNFTAARRREVLAIAIQANGQLVVGGQFNSITSNTTTASASGLVRLNPDGSIDSTFAIGSGPQWTATTSTPPDFTVAVEAIVPQPDGRLMLAGNFEAFNGTPAPGLFRINADGTSDLSYAPPVTRRAGGTTWPEMSLQPDRSILLSGPYNVSGEKYPRGLVRLFMEALPSIDLQPVAQTLLPATPATFTAHANAASTVSYQWLKNGATITGATSATYSINNPNAGDLATYSVVVTSFGGSVTSAGAALSSPTTPIIVDQPTARRAVAGGDVLFRVGAVGQGTLSYQWMKGATAVGTNSPDLRLNRVSAADAGSYSVVVTNTSGTATSNAATLAVVTPDNLLWQQFTEFSTEQAAGLRTINDGAGHVYVPWSVADRNPDMTAGSRVGALTKLNESDGTLDPTFRLDPRYRRAGYVVFQSGGNLLVPVTVGDADTVIRVNPTTGAVDATFNAPFFARGIRFITIDGNGQIVVTAADSPTSNPPAGSLAVAAPGIYRLNGTDGSVDTGFTPATLSSSGIIFGPPVTDSSNRIYLAGQFTTVNGVGRVNIARLNANGSLDTGFAVPTGQTGANLPSGFASSQARVALPQSNGSVVFLGGFHGFTLNGSQLFNSDPVMAIRFNSSGAFDSTFTMLKRSQIGMNTTIGVRLRHGLLLSDDSIVGVSDRLYHLTANGALDTTFVSRTLGKEAFWVSRDTTGRLYLADQISVAGKATTLQLWGNGIARFMSDGTPDESLQTAGAGRSGIATSGTVLSDGRVWVAGAFNRFGAITLPGLAQFAATGVSLTANQPASPFSMPIGTVATAGNDQVFALVAPDGDSTETTSTALVRLFATGAVDATFAPVLPTGYPMNYSTAIAAAPTGKVIVYQPSVDPQAALNGSTGDSMLRLNANGSRDTTFAPALASLAAVARDANGFVTMISTGGLNVAQVLPDGRALVVATGLDGSVKLQRLDGTTGANDSTFTAPSFGTITPSSGFTNIITDPQKNQTTQFNLSIYSAGDLVQAAVQTPDGRVYVGGRFALSGAPRGLVRLNANGSLDSTFTGAGISFAKTDSGPYVAALTVDAIGRIYVAGRFDSFNGTPVNGLFRLNADGSLDTGWTPAFGIADVPRASATLLPVGSKLYAFGTVANAGALPAPYAVADIYSVPTFTPLAVVSGGTITISGFGFTGATSVKINGVSATSFTVVSDNQITAVVPASAAGPVSVTTPSGVQTSTASLAISFPPNISAPPQNVTVADGTTATFSVTATAAPAPTYQWLRNNAAITGATNATYSIPAVMYASDNGAKFSVTVTNTLGAPTTAQATLTVTPNPSTPIVAPTFGAGLPAGSNNVLSALLATNATSPLSFQWNLNGAAIAGATTANYVIRGARNTDAGVYTVTVTNPAGTVTSPGYRENVVSELGWNWQNPLPTGTSYSSVAFLNGKFYVGGTRGTLLTSTDGSSWTRVPISTASNLFGIAYGNGAYVAATGLGATYRSTDGLNWVFHDGGFPATASFNVGSSIAFGTNHFVYVSASSAATSTDGITWTQGTISPTDLIAGVTFLNGKLFAAGSNAAGTAGSIYTATDGTGALSWSLAATTAAPLTVVAYGASRYVAVGNTGTIVTSTDGTTWAATTSPTAHNLTYVAFVNNLFIAMSESGDILVSPDGLAWTAATSGATALLSGVAFGNGAYVIPMQNTPSALLTTTATHESTWTNIVTSVGSNNLRGVTASPAGTVVAVGLGGAIVTSTDGATWASHVVSGVTTNLNDVAFGTPPGGTGTFVAVGNAGRIMSSPDGLTWTSQSASGPNLVGVKFVKDHFAALGLTTDGAHGVLLVSSDGISWNPNQTANQIGSVQLNSTAYGAAVGRYVVVGANGTILTWDDGQSIWTTRTSPVTAPLNDVVFAGGQFVAVGAGVVITSPDGITWTNRSFANDTFSSINYFNGTYLATAASINGTAQTTYYVSTDGINWSGRFTGSQAPWFDTAATATQLIAVGNAGVIQSAGLPVLTAPASQPLTLGGSVTFTSLITGSPTAVTYQWMKRPPGGSAFASVTGANSNTLTLTNLTSSDAGDYELTATNAFGTATSAVATLTAAPVITVQPSVNAFYASGAPVSITVTASGSPAPAFQWQKAPAGSTTFADISGATSATLALGSVTVADAGSYRVIATNGSGTATSTAVSFGILPAITTAPIAQTIVAGGTATFAAAATGSPTPTLQWRRNGLNIAGATSTTLTLTNVSFDGSGTITVTATNAGGFVTSTGVALAVNPVAPSITSPSTAAAVLGHTFTYQVNANTTQATYSLASGALPAGVTLDTVTGAITGVPTATGSFVVGIKALNVTSSDTKTLTLTVNPPPPIINSAAAATGTQGTAFTYTISAVNSPTSYGATGLPTGVTLNTTTGVISGTPTQSGAFNVTLTATNATGSVSYPVTLSIAAPANAPVYNGSSLFSAVQGTAINLNLATSFTNAPTSYAAVSGALPTNVTFNTTTAVMSGTPTQTGTFNFTFSATNAGGTTPVPLTLTINSPPSAPTITSTSLTNATAAASFSFTLTASGTAPFTFAATGLPAGLSLAPSTGVISGTPAAPGTSTVQVNATNSVGSGQQSVLVITVSPSPSAPTIDSSSVLQGQVSQAFSSSLHASSTDSSAITYAVTSGSLPAGLSLDATTGAITGSPTQVGQSTVWFAASNAFGSGYALQVLFNIAAAPTTPVITSNGTAAAQVGQPFQYQITATNGPTLFATTTLPSGLALDAATGVISGIPTTSTTTAASISLTATAAGVTSTPKILTLSIAPAPATPVITSPLSASGQAGTAFSYQTTASDNATSYVAAGLPTGLTLNATTGAISGTPTTSGTTSITLRAANANGLGAPSALTLSLAPAPSAPSITSASAVSGKVGTAFTYQITATGATNYGLTGTLPLGLTLNTSTGQLSGNPAQSGVYTVQLTATGVGGTSLPQALVLNIAPAAGVPTIVSANSANGTVGANFSYQISAVQIASDGSVTAFPSAPFPAPATLDAVNLPPGLAVNPSTGLIVGQPTAAGTFIATLVGTNAAGTGPFRTLTFSIQPAPTAPVVISTPFAAGQVGASFTYQISATNNPVSFDVLGAPAWMTINSASGALAGKPTSPGDFDVELLATNAVGSSNPLTLTVTIAPSPNAPTVTSTRLASGTVSQAFSYQITSSVPSGAPAVTTYIATGLPAGLALNAGSGLISGTPTSSGQFEITLIARSSAGDSQPVTLILTIQPNVSFNP